MCRYRFGLVFGLLATLAIWGCGQDNSGANAGKSTRLQEEVQSLAKLRDQLRQDLKTAQADRERLQAEVALLQPVVKERDDLKQNLAARTNERDTVASQLDQVKKGVKALIEQIDTTPNANASSAGATVSLAKPTMTR